MKDKVVVLTGATSGIGWEIAKICADKGAIMILMARREDKLEIIAREVRKISGRKAKTLSVDLADQSQIESAFSTIISEYQRIDVLINCAGFGLFEYLVDTDYQSIDKMFAVNVLGLIACTKAALPRMLMQKSGHIVNVASVAGKLATPKSTIYSATKHAVVGFTNALRMEIKEQGIAVTTVNPGPTRTAFFEKADPQGNYLSSVSRFMLDPTVVARKIVRAIEKKKREVNLPWYMGVGAKLYQLAPKAFEKIAGRFLKMK